MADENSGQPPQSPGAEKPPHDDGGGEQQPKDKKPEEARRYILITQCLQNGFFLSEDSRLCLPEDEVYRMLIGLQRTENASPYENKTPRNSDEAATADDTRGNRHKLHPDYKKGPLFQFLKTVIEKERRNEVLHVIHIKDWHELSQRYDDERRLYGRHCEAFTWEAEPLDGYKTYLAPWRGEAMTQPKPDQPQRRLSGYLDPRRPNVRFYEVLSDSVYDFKRSETIEHARQIQEKLDREDQLVSTSHLSLLMNHLLQPTDEEAKEGITQVRTYVVVIGVYTDIKVKTLLMGLRSRYDIDNLIVSDALTGAPSLTRNLEALDFFDKVLNVEIITNLNSIVSVLDREKPGTEEPPISSELFDDSRKWHNYRNYFVNQQTVLAYQDEQLTRYLRLTTERSLRLYNQMSETNRFLQRVGRLSLLILLILSVLYAAGFAISVEALIVTGIASVGSILSNLFIIPQERTQRNLLQLVRLRNYLESYSITSALLRHHLTTPEKLDKHDNQELREQMDLIAQAAQAIGQNFEDLVTIYEPSRDASDEGPVPPPQTNGSGQG